MGLLPRPGMTPMGMSERSTELNPLPANSDNSFLHIPSYLKSSASAEQISCRIRGSQKRISKNWLGPRLIGQSRLRLRRLGKNGWRFLLLTRLNFRLSRFGLLVSWRLVFGRSS